MAEETPKRMDCRSEDPETFWTFRSTRIDMIDVDGKRTHFRVVVMSQAKQEKSKAKGPGPGHAISKKQLMLMLMVQKWALPNMSVGLLVGW